MPRGHELDPIYSFGIYARFSENVPKVFLEYVCNGKKDRCVLFGGNNYRRVSREIVGERNIPVSSEVFCSCKEQRHLAT